MAKNGFVAEVTFKGPTSQKLFYIFINLLTTNVNHHIETTQLIFNASQLTGFYMMRNISR